MSKIIIGLVGELASGKGTAAKYCQEKYGATTYRYSTPLRDILNRLHIPLERSSLQDVSTILRKRFGEDLLAKSIAEDVRNDPNPISIVEGIRKIADIEHLRKLPNFRLVHIHADIETRYQRLISRNENTDDGQKTFAEFVRDHQAETEIEIPLIAEQADIVIENQGEEKDLFEKIDRIINA